MGTGAFGRDRARTTSRDCQSSPREERTPEGVGRCRTVTALPSDWVTAAGHDHELIFKVSSPPSFLSAFLPSHSSSPSLLPPCVSVRIDLPSPISPSLMSQRQRHSCHGHGYGLWEGEVCSSLPVPRPPRRPHAARHTNKRANVSALMWAWRAQRAVPPRGQEGEGKERVRSGSSSSS